MALLVSTSAGKHRRARSGLPAPARAVGRAGKSVLDALVLLAVLVFLALAVGPQLLPYRPISMLTGSMAPAIPAGSVLLSTYVPDEQVRVGDVITLQAPTGDREVVTHRVVEVQPADGAVLVRTRGDGNAQPDPWTARLEGEVLRSSAVLPFLGHPLTALQSPTAQLVLARALPVTLLLTLLVTVWRRPTKPRAGLVAATP